MRFCSSIMVLVVAFLLAGCRSEVHNVLDSVRASKSSGGLVKKFVDDNACIDLDVDALVRSVVKQDTGLFKGNFRYIIIDNR